jgi:predicted metalloprotease with PDZ domain
MTGVDYVVSITEPSTHEVTVTATFPAAGETLELFMPVWTPGSYLVREYSRHLLAIETSTADGRSLPIDKVAKNRWRVSGLEGVPHVVVRYRLYAREMSVRTNFVDAEFALVVGAATFVTTAGAVAGPCRVRMELPEGWTSHTSLAAAPGGAAHHYEAPDFDTLLDSPIACGATAARAFVAGGRAHDVVDVGDHSQWNGEAAAADVQKIVEAQQAFWRCVPYDRYLFINAITEAGGGLEHASSTVLMTSRFKTRTRKAYLEWLRLASHEFFHAWNVKRLRPVELGPFDYERENHTRALWIAEGVTEYYGDLLVRRAGLCSDREYLDELGAQVEQVQTTPGRLLQPLGLASFDAWIKHYRPDENSPNAAMSYYTKGCVVAFLLDAAIRRATSDARSLDDVMRLAYERHSGPRGYREAEFRTAASDVAACDLGPWLARAVDSTEELDYAPALDWLGLRLRAEDPPADRPPRAYLGVTTRNDGGRLLVTGVRHGTPAAAAGISPDDEILALGGYRVRADQLESRLEVHRAGESVPILVARRERLLSLHVTPAEPPRPLKLEADPAATPDQQARLKAWLGG